MTWSEANLGTHLTILSELLLFFGCDSQEIHEYLKSLKVI